MSEQGKSMLNTKNLLVIIIVIIVGIAAYFIIFNRDNSLIKKSNNTQNNEQQTNDKYQAVFLTNGQVYFGKLEDKGGNYVKLTDIYYLQAQDKVQPKDENTANDQSNLTLIKLGKELHAPADEMNISRQQILFWEDITADGKVMKAIEEYKANNQ
jgi:uncharacterized protein (UPF0333 family)